MITGSWIRGPRGGSLTPLSRRLRWWHPLALTLAIGLAGGLTYTWYRSSSFVRVEHVEVTGLSGPDVPQIRRALTDAALQMTTLDMNIAKLEASVAGYAFIQRLQVTTRGAHGVVIEVAEQVPVALLEFDGRTAAVDARGRILSGTIAHGLLPALPLRSAPTGGRVTGARAREVIRVLAATPYPLLARIASATSSRAHGVIVQLRSGPQLYFGDAAELGRKWLAAVAVLQNSLSGGASYIDVTDPQRPAAGAGVSPTQAAALGLAASAPAPASGSGQAGSSSAGSGGGAANASGGTTAPTTG